MALMLPPYLTTLGLLKMSNLDLLLRVSDAIENGEMDKQLKELQRLVDGRLASIGEAKSIDDFSVGDRVVINERCGTRFLRGESASVVGRRRTKLVINLDNPKGRFARTTSAGQILSAEVIVPIEILDKL